MSGLESFISMACSRLACWATCSHGLRGLSGRLCGHCGQCHGGILLPSSVHPTCVPVCHHLCAGGPALPRKCILLDDGEAPWITKLVMRSEQPGINSIRGCYTPDVLYPRGTKYESWALQHLIKLIHIREYISKLSIWCAHPRIHFFYPCRCGQKWIASETLSQKQMRRWCLL